MSNGDKKPSSKEELKKKFEELGEQQLDKAVERGLKALDDKKWEKAANDAAWTLTFEYIDVFVDDWNELKAEKAREQATGEGDYSDDVDAIDELISEIRDALKDLREAIKDGNRDKAKEELQKIRDKLRELKKKLKALRKKQEKALKDKLKKQKNPKDKDF
jgi:hypothetical protein